MLELHLTPEDNLSDILNALEEPATIYLKDGVYKQKVWIKKDNLKIIGENRETTVITYDDYARKIHSDGQEYNTFRTYTLCVTGNNVVLENLTVENSNTNPSEVGQCVALSVNCRNFKAVGIDLKSTQDTLFCYPFPDDIVVRHMDLLPHEQLYLEGTSLHLFEKCRIYGTVDFIFGGAEAYFKDCEIISTDDSRGRGYIAAPCHSLTQKNGLTFIDCDIKSEGAGEGTIYLARPWRDFGKSVFINCRVGKHIKPEMFDKWNDTYRNRTARFTYYNLKCDFTPDPVKWSRELTAAEAEEIIATCERSFEQFGK